MVTSIGGALATQAAYAPAPTPKKNDAQVDEATTAMALPGQEDSAAAPAVSLDSAAAARLGDQLNAQADASRVQRAVDESTQTQEGGETAAAQTDAAQAPAGGAPPAGGAAPAGGGGAASAETTDTDYIAEADTNSDKTVSDKERAVYEARLRQQAEVRAAYGQEADTAPALDVTA